MPAMKAVSGGGSRRRVRPIGSRKDYKPPVPRASGSRSGLKRMTAQGSARTKAYNATVAASNKRSANAGIGRGARGFGSSARRQPVIRGGGGIKMPSFEAHFNFDPIRGLGDAFRSLTAPNIQRTGNALKNPFDPSKYR